MKRSRSVTLVAMGAAALGGCDGVEDRTAARPIIPPVEIQTLAAPPQPIRCDKPEDFPLPECHRRAAEATSSAPRGGGFVYIHSFAPYAATAYGPATPAARIYARTGAALRPVAPQFGSAVFRGGFGQTGRSFGSIAARGGISSGG